MSNKNKTWRMPVATGTAESHPAATLERVAEPGPRYGSCALCACVRRIKDLDRCVRHAPAYLPGLGGVHPPVDVAAGGCFEFVAKAG